MFKNYTDCLFDDKTILKPQQRFKSDYSNVYTEQINKIALISNDDKRLQTIVKLQHIHTEQFHFKVGESEMLTKYKSSTLMITRIRIKHCRNCVHII